MSYIACAPQHYSVLPEDHSLLNLCSRVFSPPPCVPVITMHPHWLCIVYAHPTRKFLCSIHRLSSSESTFLAFIVTFSLVSPLRFISPWPGNCSRGTPGGLSLLPYPDLGFGSQHPEPGHVSLRQIGGVRHKSWASSKALTKPWVSQPGKSRLQRSL